MSCVRGAVCDLSEADGEARSVGKKDAAKLAEEDNGDVTTEESGSEFYDSDWD